MSQLMADTTIPRGHAPRSLNKIPENCKAVVALNINETRTVNIVREFERRGIRVTTFDTPRWTDLIVNFYSFTKALLGSDFVFCGTRIPIQIPWMLLARLFRRPCIIDCPMDITEWPFSQAARWRWLVRLALRSANLVLTIKSRAYMVAKFGLKKERVLFIESCPDLDLIAAASDAQPRFRPRPGTFLICWSGGHEHHRLQRFMPIFESLIKLAPNVELLIIADPAKECVLESRRYAEAAGISDRLHFLPVIHPFEDFYATVAQCNLWVATLGDDNLQGKHELRMELLELGVLGKAVVAAPTPALVEHGLTSGREILCIDPADSKGSARQIAELAKNPAALARLGQNLRAHILENYSQTKAIDGLLRSL
jgi:glycosyltransferase involved in cell wall biosynthesis